MIQVATVMGACQDLRMTAFKIMVMMPKDEYLVKGKAAFKESVTPILKKLEYSLKGKKYICGDNIVYEDFGLLELTDWIRLYDIKFLKQFPSLFAHNNAIRALP